jgi:ADP-ribose pyrophosphatase
MPRVYKGRLIELGLEEVTLPGGAKVTLEIVRHPGASAVVALERDRKVVLVRQFRNAAGGFIWEIPAGIPHRGESPLDCAKRELGEETGMAASEWTPLGSILTSPGFCDERIHLFLARGLSSGEQTLDHDEILTVVHVPLGDALEMVRNGEIQDAKSVAGLHLAAACLRN